MAVTESDRRALHAWLDSVMGRDRATTLMTLLPPNDASDLATKPDIDERFDRVDERFDRVDERFARVDKQFDRVDERFAAIDREFARVDQRFNEIDVRFAEARADREAMRASMLKVFGTWLFASQAAVIAAVGLLLAVMR